MHAHAHTHVRARVLSSTSSATLGTPCTPAHLPILLKPRENEVIVIANPSMPLMPGRMALCPLNPAQHALRNSARAPLPDANGASPHKEQTATPCPRLPVALDGRAVTFAQPLLRSYSCAVTLALSLALSLASSPCATCPPAHPRSAPPSCAAPSCRLATHPLHILERAAASLSPSAGCDRRACAPAPLAAPPLRRPLR